MSKKRVLILSEGFGSGHTQAGHALAAGIRKLWPDAKTKVMELGSFLNPIIAPWILSAYRVTVNTSPSLVGMLYRKKYEKPVGRLTRLALHKMFYQHASDVIGQLQPDVIVCTHPIPNAVVARLRASGLRIPLYTLITDYDAHGAWISPEVNQYLVSTLEVKTLLQQRGVNPDTIQVTGIPVHPNFWSIQDKASARKDLGIKQMPTVLVMGGGWGLHFKEELIDKLIAWRDKVQIICCTGSNGKLTEKLRACPEMMHENITIIGHTHEVSKWMDASDILITKPGGMTCTEGLAKGIPMLFFESIPGQEEKNREYFVSHGYGMDMSSPEIIDQWFSAITNPSRNTMLHDKISQLRPQAYEPDCCAKNVIKLLRENSIQPELGYAYL
ncbi:MGDG synthase family glycosyltransferase [Paenibacillus woosongensis]|uniref:UDP-N-acetylglucosamine--LPS N-acetylglucosamine transferase n=1 Tax=Paenibacillus woosongensis TaxID=307580 RepID=A0A7X3CNN3_9BACL|nr:glycosyltransferase [Paenibacillus woosongensis]MUG45989.1 UDP-N-acetylglucosamine--LPS N-acetylglucosamine transferase [Paenibacillus woosongensis]